MRDLNPLAFSASFGNCLNPDQAASVSRRRLESLRHFSTPFSKHASDNNYLKPRQTTKHQPTHLTPPTNSPLHTRHPTTILRKAPQEAAVSAERTAST